MVTTFWEALITVLIKWLGAWVEGLKAHHVQLQAAKNAQAAATTADTTNQQTAAEVEQSHDQEDAALNRVAAGHDAAERLLTSAHEADDATTRANDQL